MDFADVGLQSQKERQRYGDWFMIRTVLSAAVRRHWRGVLKRALYAGIKDGAFKHDDVVNGHEIIGGLLLLGAAMVSAKSGPRLPR